jgi:DNA-binding MarR family transcriptional regulator
LTPAGRDLLAAAVPVWRETHAEIEDAMGEPGAERLREDLRALG